MLARSNKGDLGAEHRADLDCDEMTTAKRVLTCFAYSLGSDELLLRVVMEKPYYTPGPARTASVTKMLHFRTKYTNKMTCRTIYLLES